MANIKFFRLPTTQFQIDAVCALIFLALMVGFFYTCIRQTVRVNHHNNEEVNCTGLFQFITCACFAFAAVYGFVHYEIGKPYSKFNGYR